MNKSLAAAVLVLAAAAAHAASTPHRCAADAADRAKKLLSFHFGSADPRMEIDPDVKTLPPLANPANRKQRFEVLEVWGYIYKGQYRMRLIYAPDTSSCVLMGQEIMEHASP